MKSRAHGARPAPLSRSPGGPAPGACTPPRHRPAKRTGMRPAALLLLETNAKKVTLKCPRDELRDGGRLGGPGRGGAQSARSSDIPWGSRVSGRRSSAGGAPVETPFPGALTAPSANALGALQPRRPVRPQCPSPPAAGAMPGEHVGTVDLARPAQRPLCPGPWDAPPHSHGAPR